MRKPTSRMQVSHALVRRTKHGWHTLAYPHTPTGHSTGLVFLQAHFQPHSWVSALAAPRETVVQQLWRQDEHGVYLVMVHSTDHAAAPETEHPWWHWYSPVRSQVHLSSIALSPHLYILAETSGRLPISCCLLQVFV